ncbi:MAG: hypothetical protein LBI17_03015 [Rickettsiales bacterium]|jgi:hypothetical protein|nr:hypothetical protein [Rickettsiales bacterium]
MRVVRVINEKNEDIALFKIKPLVVDKGHRVPEDVATAYDSLFGYGNAMYEDLFINVEEFASFVAAIKNAKMQRENEKVKSARKVR